MDADVAFFVERHGTLSLAQCDVTRHARFGRPVAHLRFPGINPVHAHDQICRLRGVEDADRREGAAATLTNDILPLLVQPDGREILVHEMAWTDLPTLDIGPMNHDSIPPQ